MKKKDLGLILGKEVRKARRARGFTQATMAEHLDVSVEFYGRIERGAARPSTELFARMVAILGVSADTLLGRDVARSVAPAPLTRPDDPAELRELVALLYKARPSVLQLMSALVREFEHAHGDRKLAGGRQPATGKRGRGSRKPPPSSK